MNYGPTIVQETLRSLGIRQGNSNYQGWMKAKCPLHDDKSPSFSININTGEWRCWSGCGGNKDLAVLIATVNKTSFAQARKDLFWKVASDPRALADMLAPTEIVYKKQEPIFYDRNKLPKYFLDRGFTVETAKKWQIGYEPELHGIAIPVKEDGRLVGLITRTITGKPMKYITSTGFIKSNYLFGIDHVDPSSKWTFVVEGPLNAVWLNQLGYPAIALMGLDISRIQKNKLLGRFSEIVLALDNDVPIMMSSGKLESPGIRATKKVIQELKGIECSILPLPVGRDVQNLNKIEIEKAYKNKIKAWEWASAMV